MIFQEFIENAKRLPLGQEYPYLPSPKSSDSKKYKLLEVSNDSIKVERDGAETSISIPHIKTLLENMKDEIPLDVEKTLGSGGNTRSIEEALLCLIPSIFYTRINNRKHIVESSKYTHELGKIEEWKEYPSAKDLGDILRKMYDTADNKQQVVSIHMFAVKYGKVITEKDYKPAEIIKYSGLNESYSSEVTKGINIYKYLKSNPSFLSQLDISDSTEAIENVAFIINKASPFLLSQFNKDDNSFSTRYILSLLAKPFVILTGNSGTGKTRIAMQFANYLEKKNEAGSTNHLLIPVGADWTDNTKILGFYNPLKKEYQSTPVLDFMLLAEQNPAIPFFLILDEMNLSHVERYFSDFLSAMESGEPISLYKKDEETDSAIPEKITLPKNLFVTGTVNIDETTYMFSPKVLDRANVIEFKPEMEAVLDNVLSESEKDEMKPAEPGTAEGFMELASKVRSNAIPAELQSELEKIKPVLEAVYKILEKSGFEFAYRTAKEIRLYAFASYEACGDKTEFSVDSVIDQQIVQKILPKIHGNKRQIGSLLAELKNELVNHEELELSLNKVQSMIEKLDKYQYTSFI